MQGRRSVQAFQFPISLLRTVKFPIKSSKNWCHHSDADKEFLPFLSSSYSSSSSLFATSSYSFGSFPDVLPRPPLLILIHLLLLLLPLRSLHPVYPLLSSLLFSTFFRWKRSASSQIRLRRYPSHSSVVHSTPILFPRVVGNSPERERLADSVNIGPAVAHARGWRARVVVRPNDSFWQVKWTTDVILETSPVPCT